MPQDFNDATVRQFYRANQANKMRSKDPKGVLKVVSQDARDTARQNARDAETERERQKLRSEGEARVKARRKSSGKRR